MTTSALAGAGCHIVLFSTGCSMPYGGSMPSVKRVTNSELAAKKLHWVDLDAGSLLRQFIDMIVATGRQARNKEKKFGELAFF